MNGTRSFRSPERRSLLTPRPRSRRESGFSLLEVMVAVAIFALTVMTLFVVRGRAVEQAHLAKNVELAQRYGKLLLEDILLGNRIYTDGDAGTFEPPDAKNLTYEIAIEEVTVAGTPPDEEDDAYRSRGAATVGGRREASSKMDDLFGGGGGRKSASSRKNAGGDSGEEGGLDAQESPAAASGSKKKKKGGGGGGGLFGGGDEEAEPEILYRVTVKVHYPVLDTTESLTLETFVPPPPEEGEEEDETGATSGQPGGKQKAGDRGGKQGGGGGNKRGRRGGAENDLFGG